MAITSCNECGKEVSTEAKTCPHCGIALKPPFLTRGRMAVLAAGAIAIIGGFIYSGHLKETEEAAISACKARILEDLPYRPEPAFMEVTVSSKNWHTKSVEGVVIAMNPVSEKVQKRTFECSVEDSNHHVVSAMVI